MEKDNQQKQDYNMCNICNKTFKRKSALYYHVRRVHKIAVQFINRKNKFKCPDSSCSLTFHLANLLRNHIQDVHNVKIEMCQKVFNTYNEFKAWKDEVQDETRSLYTSCQNMRCDKYRRYLYTCYRSGGYIPSKSSGKRKLISKKIDGWCPAGMEVKAFDEGGVFVKYWMTHFGHQCEVDCLNLTHNDKLMIAQKLEEGLSIEKILDDVRESVVDADGIKRIHLLSRRDVINISKSFKISKKETFNKDECPTINSWVQSMETLGKDSPVIFFKKRNSEHIMLKNYDYLLVIMTKIQQKLLENCSHKVVCLDDIRVTQTYNFHVVTLMSIDDSNIACPLAYGIANKVDENVISLILEIINNKVGRISTDIFMSSDIPAFYGSWQKHMGPANTHLLCTWQVDKDWRKGLEKLSCSREKKGKIYKTLKQLMIEPNFIKFRSQLEDSLEQFSADPEFQSFYDMFKIKYVERDSLWASCYRSQQILHYSANAELVHKNLVECYEEGRVSNSFIKPLNSIFRFSRDKVLEKLQKFPNVFQINNLGNICRSNEEIKEIVLMKPQDVSEKLLLFPVVEKDGCFVEYNADNICPPPMCDKCICFHKFTCTCVENFINLNICSHIVASAKVMQDQCSQTNENNSEIRYSETVLPQCNDSINKIINEAEESTKKNLIHSKMDQSIAMDIDVTCAGGSVLNFDADMSKKYPRIVCMEDSVDNRRVAEFVEVVYDNENCITEEFNKDNVSVNVCSESNKENSEEESETTASNTEAYKSFLLQKVVFIHDMLMNRSFNSEEYKIFDEYLDKIIVVSSYSSQ